MNKRYKSFKFDLKELMNELSSSPSLGADLGGGLRKVRMAIKSKGTGKSGGARIITVVLADIKDGLGLLYIYDKSERSTVKGKELTDLLKKNSFSFDMLLKKGVNYEEKKLKVFTLPIEEFEKKYPVSYSIVSGIPEGHVARVVSVRPCLDFIILKDKTIEQYDEIPCCRCLPSSISNRDSSFYSSSLFSSSPIRYLMS